MRARVYVRADVNGEACAYVSRIFTNKFLIGHIHIFFKNLISLSSHSFIAKIVVLGL